MGRPVNLQVVYRRCDTAARFQEENLVLAKNEDGYETDTGKLKIGNGSSTWDQLPYLVPESHPQAVIDGGTP